MGGELKVNFAHLEQVATDVRQGARNIDDRLDRLEDQLRFLESDWTGEARESYRKAKKDWNDAVEAMTTILRDLGGAVTEAKIRYQETERVNRDRFQG